MGGSYDIFTLSSFLMQEPGLCLFSRSFLCLHIFDRFISISLLSPFLTRTYEGSGDLRLREVPSSHSHLRYCKRRQMFCSSIRDRGLEGHCLGCMTFSLIVSQPNLCGKHSHHNFSIFDETLDCSIRKVLEEERRLGDNEKTMAP